VISRSFGIRYFHGEITNSIFLGKRSLFTKERRETGAHYFGPRIFFLKEQDGKEKENFWNFFSHDSQPTKPFPSSPLSLSYYRPSLKIYTNGRCDLHHVS